MPYGNFDWLDHNGQRAYPLTATATSKSTTGEFELSSEFLVALDLTVPAGLGLSTVNFFISSFSNLSSGSLIQISYYDGSASTVVASCLIPSTAAENSVHTLQPSSAYPSATGKVTCGSYSVIRNQPSGEHAFDLADSRLEPQVIRPVAGSIPYISVSSAGSSSPLRLTGPVEFVAGANFRIDVDRQTTKTVLKFSAIEGEGLTETCVCEGDPADLPCIKTINNKAVNPDGNFVMTGDDCYSFDAVSDGIQVTDNCSTPCCGWPEMEQLTAALEEIQTRRQQLETVQNTLRASVESFRQNLMSSRDGAARCQNCEDA